MAGAQEGPNKPSSPDNAFRRTPKKVQIQQKLSYRSDSSSPEPEDSGQSRPGKVCPNPECDDGTKTEEGEGMVLCTACGAVVSEKQLTQDVQFGEAANGQAIVQGVHVGEGQETARSAPGSSRIMGGTASKDMAVSDARRELTRLAANPAWNIRQHDVEKAERVFKLAYNYGHTKGRDRTHICAVCLYIAIRQRPASEGTLMLIDFADFVSVSVFYLGRLYTELCAEIRINHEATVYQIRPELLAHRFCEELGLGENTYRIAQEAVNIIKRMNRDWLVRGRRPSGIVGAAVILAARMNNYRRTVRELVYTAKVCEYTITKRLDEFRCTPVSKLTVNQVRGQDWDTVASEAIGPPALYPEAFKLKKVKERKGKSKESGEDLEEHAGLRSRSGSQVDTEDGERQRSSNSAAMTENPTTHQRNTTASAKAVTSDHKQADADRQAMPPPSTRDTNIDPELLKASSQALRDIGDDENAERLANGRKRRGTDFTDGEDADADIEGDAGAESQPKRKKRQIRPLPEPTPDVLADEEQLEADINEQLRDADMLAQIQLAHDEAINAPSVSLELDGDGNSEEHDGDAEQDEETENNTMQQYLGLFHHQRPEYDGQEDTSGRGDETPTLPLDEEWTSLNHADIQQAYKETMKHAKSIMAKYPTTTAALLAKIPSSEEISDSEFAEDPDVNDMILDEQEKTVKEAFWISRYGKHLKERHLKKVQKLIDEENGNVKQPRRRGSKKPKPGDDSGYARDKDGKVGNGWIGTIKANFEQRGSNKLNYAAIGKLLETGSPSSLGTPTSRAPSVVGSVSGSVNSRQSTPSRATRQPIMARLPKNGKIPPGLTPELKKSDAVTSKGSEAAKQAPTPPPVASATVNNDDDGDDYDEDEEDEDEDDEMFELTNVSEEVRNLMNAGLSREEAEAAANNGGDDAFGIQ